MLSDNFRPWGHFSWVANKTSAKDWHLIGCLATEDRFITAAELAKKNFNLLNSFFIEVIDEGVEYQDITSAKNTANSNELEAILGAGYGLKRIGLLSSTALLKNEIIDFIEKSNGNIILDISCFPKRFFFPILKILLTSEKVNNLSVCYTVPEAYHDGELAEDPLAWSHIPMFQSCTNINKKTEKAIVGVGFISLGLPSLLKNDYSDAEVTLLFPFPPGPPNNQRTWKFVREIEISYPLDDPNQIIRVDVKDVSGCYDHLLGITGEGRESSILAPYGPKTQSLAMALFSIKYDCSVFYTQPKQYHPDYSSGVKNINGVPETYMYCIKLNGRDLY
jgi:hypothetical protein